LQTGIGNDQSNIGVAVVETTVLRVLRSRARVDRAVVRPHDDIGRSTVLQRIVNRSLRSSPPITSSINKGSALVFR
jgi:hypothetical protein